MKTQLLQDFQESGSAPSTPPSPPPSPAAPRRRPAVWHGPGSQRAEAGAAVQKADPGPAQRAPEVSARGKGVAIEALADRIAQARTARPAPPAPPPPPADEPTVPGAEARPHPEPPRPPEPPPAADHIPPPVADRIPLPVADQIPPPVADPIPPPRADTGTVPRPVQPDIEAEWLAARLREEAAAREAPAWTSMWKRRLVTWSIAGGLLAGLAAGGLWLYEENRVEDALVVVANMSPAGQPSAAAFVARAPAPAPVPVLVRPAVTPEPVKPVPDEPVAPVIEDKAPAAAPVDVTPPRRAARHKTTVKKQGTAKARRTATKEAPPVAADPSPRQRREETLMQCRAHGYDARRCIERACTMTRYGLACKG
ncbi:hypothetical protein [Massilia orientalis]|uniref:Uncharacterized protein n=1 Tax=Massilia orientalis TaxID=3050128 RepID=A0ACC7M5C8_9BURK|nr:hypothetical protein [Massilia sp. YIM B02787]